MWYRREPRTLRAVVRWLTRRRSAMFDNVMTGAVGFAIHEDQLAQAAARRRAKEAMRTCKVQRRVPSPVYREAMARALVALATRSAPSVTGKRVSTAR